MIPFDALNWYGHFNTITGYGNVNLAYPMALAKRGKRITLGWQRYDYRFPEWQYLSAEQRAFMETPYTEEHLGIIKALPTEFVNCTNKVRIGYTMVENTKVNAEWIAACNTMDGILVPCDFLIKVFQDSGCKVPMASVRQGMDSNTFPFFDRSLRDRQTFVFGTVGFMDDRKNWQDLISAFISEFDITEPVELWIKNSNLDWGYFDIADDRIKIIKTRYTIEELNQLYQLMDCFVCPSHAEGSGLTPREAMATGLPTILTNWSGLTEIALPSISYPLTPVSIDWPDFRKDEQPGFQARLDVRELMYFMRYVYEHRTEALLKGKRASEFVHREYNWDTCARLLVEKVEGLL